MDRILGIMGIPFYIRYKYRLVCYWTKVEWHAFVTLPVANLYLRHVYYFKMNNYASYSHKGGDEK